MKREILELFLVFAGCMSTLFCVTAVVLVALRRRNHRLPTEEVTRRLDEISDRLGRLDASIDTVAVEVERISEAQRFTARVLADRATAPALPDKIRPGTTTPH